MAACGTSGSAGAAPPGPGRLHWLPCSIAHDGPAAVADNFKPEPTGARRGGG